MNHDTDAPGTAMNCDEIADRLVAFQDDELGPSERDLVARHLRGCADCAAHEQALAAVTPKPSLVLPRHQQFQHWDKLDQALAAAAAEDLAPQVIRPSLWARLRDGLFLPLPAVAGYALLLLLSLGFGLSQWHSARTLQAELRHRAPAVAATPMPADQYRPASWSPEGDEPAEAPSEP